MEQELYRKKSMDRISSPEQLNDYLRVTSPSVWVILTAVILLLVGTLIWSSVATIVSSASGTSEVSGGVMTIRFSDQKKAANVEVGMPVSAGNTETVIAHIGRDANGLAIATADTSLPDGFYPVEVQYKRTQVLQLLFD